MSEYMIMYTNDRLILTIFFSKCLKLVCKYCKYFFSYAWITVYTLINLSLTCAYNLMYTFSNLVKKVWHHLPSFWRTRAKARESARVLPH